MTSRAPHLDLTVAWADAELQELHVAAANERFAGRVSLYASPDELIDVAARLRAFLAGRSERREFLLGQEDFAGHGTVRLGLHRKAFAETLLAEVTLRANPAERLARAESAELHVPATVADLERFEADLRRIAQRLGTRAGFGG